MATPEASIWLAIRAHLETLVLTPAHTIAWPNEPFDPPMSGNQPAPYLRVQHFPNDVSAVTMGTTGRNRFYGLTQVTAVGVVRHNLAVVQEIAGQVADHFALGTDLTEGAFVVRIDRPPVVGPAVPGDGTIEVPVTIRWSCDATR